jgi:hypothetical protein
MSAATTIAPALNPIPSAPARRVDPPPADPAPAIPAAPAESPAIVAPQHMQALARANEVRLARAELKRQVGAGRISAAEVVLVSPWEAESMPLIELLSAQRRWGRARSRKLIVQTGLTENKHIGTLTERQRKLLAAALEAKVRT